MSDFIWGLTTKNIENAFWNSINQDVMLFGGMAVAGVTAMIAQSVLSSNARSGKSSELKPAFCVLVGIAAGIAATFHYADHLPYVTFAADKALKFVVISVVAGALGLKAGWAGTAVTLITWGGACGYFGRDVLRAGGVVGAVLGGLLTLSNKGN